MPLVPRRQRNTDYIALDNLDDPSVMVQSPPLTPPAPDSGAASSQMYLLPERDIRIDFVEDQETSRTSAVFYAEISEDIRLEIAPGDFVHFGREGELSSVTGAPDGALPLSPISPGGRWTM